MINRKHGEGTHFTKMSADKSAENTPNAPKFIYPNCLPKPKVWNFDEKRRHWASVVRVFSDSMIQRNWDGLRHNLQEDISEDQLNYQVDFVLFVRNKLVTQLEFWKQQHKLYIHMKIQSRKAIMGFYYLSYFWNPLRKLT